MKKLFRTDIDQLLSKITVAKIEALTKHEGADSLWITQLNVGGDADLVQVVTAATNIKEGDLVPYLAPGGMVPGAFFADGTEFVLDSRKMRGEMSHGMILAADEIGLSDDHEGIFVLDAGNPGQSLLEILSEAELEKIYDRVGAVEITTEIQARIDLITSIAEGGEIVGEEELARILIEAEESGETLYTYDGFEPSGQMHIAQGIIRAINTNKMIKAGFTFRMWVADWFGYLNGKMGGDLEKIKKVGEYFIEIWRASGMDLDNTEFLWTSDFVGDGDYWELVMRVSRANNLKRILRTTEIMGRGEDEALAAAQIIYPCMQTADIFHVMKAKVVQLGMDQRKVNMLAREVGPDLGFWKPVVVSHHMLQGLGKPAPEDADAVTRAISMKMSKSKPDTAIFMTDTPEDVSRKIRKAYCPEGEVTDNPILEYCKYVIFEAYHLKGREELLKDGFVVRRPEKFGGDVSYQTYAELEAAFKAKELFPLDLKNAVVEYINLLLEPVRKHFAEDKKASELLKQVQSFQITR